VKASLASGLSLSLLGGFQVRLGSGGPLTLSNSKAQALLAYLAVAPGRRHPRDKLATLLWSGVSDEQARQSLRQVLVTLRRVLANHANLIAEHAEVALEGPRLDVDVVRFEALVRDGSTRALAEAAALYQGDLLEGIRVKEPPFEEWLLAERERLREMVVEALARLLEHQVGGGPVTPAIRTAMRILTLDPARESVHRDLMRLFERQGRRGDALRQYRLCVDALQRELGLEPRPETRRLYQDIVRAGQTQDTSTAAEPTKGATMAPSRPRGLAVERAREAVPLVGRDAELARLHQAIQATGRGVGRLVLVLGEAGIGKTSLLEAIEVEAHQRGVRSHLGRSYLSEQVLPFAPWIDALRAGERLDDPQLLACLGPAWVAELARLIPELKVGAPDRAGEGSHRLFEAVTRLVSCLAAQQPRLIMLEDVHWADEMSLRLLAFVARRIRSARVLIVATAREEEVAGEPAAAVFGELSEDPLVERMILSPLSRQETATLVRSLAQASAATDTVARLAEQIFSASEGNPFIVVETMRALADGTQTPTGSALPGRVKQVIAGRLERLGERSRGVLAAASVIGREFEFALLQRATGLDEAEVAEEIEALVRRRVLRVVGERFDFVHDRVREVVHSQLLPPRRVLLHAAVARALERFPAGRPDEHVERLAHHTFRGELWEKAVAYGQHAGSVAAERSASGQAGACFDQALEALARLPESRETLEQAIELRRLRVAHHFALGEREGILRCMKEALGLAERLGDQPRLATVVAAWANALWFAGDNPRALEAGSRAVDLAEATGDPVTRISASLNLGMICGSVGDHHRAVGLFARAVQLLGGGLQRERLGRTLYPSVNARGELARSQAELGDFDSALATIAEARRIAETLQHSSTLKVLLLDACHVLLCRGDFLDAMPQLETCLQDFRGAGFPAWSCAAAAMLGYADVMTGRIGDGMPLLREALEQVARGRRTREAVFMSYLCEAQWLARRPDEAFALAEQALTLSRERHERSTEARILFLLGEISAQDVDRDEPTGERHYHAALAIAGELGLRPLVAHCHLGLGKLYRRTGERPESEQHLSTATTMYREMGMTYWLEQAATEVKELE
jgi:DNA-binding SARP family transcriptional activator/tetratricopeptide (TPR) repeat protein